jgi:outer membrane protein OmpA-like peptidoglycan-associated protein
MELKKLKTIDELFQSKLSDYEPSQKGESWQLLNHLINEQQKKKKIVFRIKTIIASLTAMSIVLFFMFQFWNTTDNTPKIGINYSPITIEPPISNTPTLAHDNEPNSSNSQSLIKNRQFPNSKILNSQLKIINQKPPISISNEVNTADVILSSTKEAPKENIDYLESISKSIYVYLGKDSVKAKILNMGQELNSPFADYAPVINADGSEMYFTSRRPVTKKEKKQAIASNENVYYTAFDANNKKWKASKMLPPPVNDPKRFNSVIAISNDGQRMLLYRDDKYGNGDIFESILEGTTWSKPDKLPEPINSKYMESSASISPDGRTIYFVSNRPSGQGGLDIWSCTKNQQGQWGEAKNLGSSVNSTENEEGVFIHPDGKTLYFSSRGHKGFGGYDIFSTTLENGNWSTPKNLGVGINSSDDDVYFVMEANGKVGYYSSFRKEGIGEKDIYRINFSSPKKEKGPLLTLFKGLVIDKETHQPLASEIEIIDLDKNEQITVLKSNAASGSFLVSLPSGKNYGINVKKEGYLFYSENMNIPVVANYKEIIKTVLLDKLKTGAKIILKNIFYDYDKATLRNESINELDRLYELLVKNPKLKVELSAHTDSRGNNEYNNKLSQERAQSCVDYLVKKGISEQQLIAKGYGKQQLLITDIELNNIKTEIEKEAAHQQNRRTEFTIIENF